MNVGIIGCGAFGYALAIALAEHHSVTVYDVVPEYITSLQQTGKHPVFFRDKKPPIQAVSTPKVCVQQAEVVILAVPAQAMREAITPLKEILPSDAILLNAAKALEGKSNKRMSEVITEVLGSERPIAMLAGPMFAHDVAEGKHMGATLACTNERARETIAALFAPTKIHVQQSTDLLGVEFAGSFKNVAAIAAGLIGNFSTKSYVLTQLCKELEHLAIELGAQSDTFRFESFAWTGDIMLTCFGEGRNVEFGKHIRNGMSAEEARKELESMKKHAEGYATIEVIKTLTQVHDIRAPFCSKLHSIVYDGEDPTTLSSVSSDD